ncbi:hypothetical protein E4O03_07160 [Treponema sp. OMZ 792]|uniref:hypothetical protein n=1 Tax=unclassified Treponema TaxID=2638727 RepID=UPI0020A34D17|nr:MULTISPECIES: hypothetical protein [unclassified Treponema]UTC74034.1 hypothetical protein E4O03_07160 [Treponema sp. OMZ 792]UTC80434.1 hypothetical protein E4O07_07060 [Treponema sp. OMZ 798]
MSTLSIRIPDSYHMMVKEVSKTDNISINQFITAAIGEKLTALQTENYVKERAKKGSKEKFLAVLNKAPDIEPEEYDM